MQSKSRKSIADIFLSTGPGDRINHPAEALTKRFSCLIGFRSMHKGTAWKACFGSRRKKRPCRRATFLRLGLWTSAPTFRAPSVAFCRRDLAKALTTNKGKPAAKKAAYLASKTGLHLVHAGLAESLFQAKHSYCSLHPL